MHRREHLDIGRRVAEHPFAHGVGPIDDAVTIGGDDHVLDVIEDDLELRGALLGDFHSKRPRVIRHELHRTHHGAALVVDGVVVAAEHFQELVRAHAPTRHARAQLPQLTLQQRMQAPHGKIADVDARTGGAARSASRQARISVVLGRRAFRLF